MTRQRIGGSSPWLLAPGTTGGAASPCIDVSFPTPRGWRVTLHPLTQPGGQSVTENIGGIPRAIIEAGIGDISVTYAVDWPFSGTCFDVCAAALRVSGFAIPAVAIPSRGSSSTALLFRAWASPHNGDMQPTYTTVVGSVLADDESVFTAIPAGATDVVMWALSDAGAGPVAYPEAFQLQWSGVAIPGTAKTNYLGALSTNTIMQTPAPPPPFYPAAGADSMLATVGVWSPVPPFAQGFTVRNPPMDNSGNLFNVAVQFRLSL